MKTALGCIPCFMNQSLAAASRLGLSETKKEALLREMMTFLSRQEWKAPPPVLARETQRFIRELVGNRDPYLDQKRSDTSRALSLLPEIEQRVAESSWPFMTAVQFSIAGNAIDFGAAGGWNPSVGRSFENALTKSLDANVVTRLEQAVSDARTILFLTDNCGEIVFDRPLLGLIGREKVTAAVRGAPVLNDATTEDAERSGLTERFRVLSNGSDVPGTWLEDCTADFRHLFDTADLVISKGQGNYECLSNTQRSICFLFMVKCAFVAEQIGMPTGSHVIYLNRT